MTAVGLLTVEKQGRHRYHRLATPSVARMMESIMQVAADLEPNRNRLTVGPRDAALRKARTCYDHLAGQLGVCLADALVEQGRVELTNDAGLLTKAGIEFLGEIGNRSGRVLCRPCLDWSERRPHLAGSLGATLCAHSMDNGWTRRIQGTRAVEVTPKGERVMREKFRVRGWPIAERS
jgi:hypothetical protein